MAFAPFVPLRVFSSYTMLDGAGFSVRAYMSGGHFLSDRTPRGGCVVANVLLADMDGLELLRQAAAQNMETPVVLFSPDADVPLAVAAMKAGAVDFLLCPFGGANKRKRSSWKSHV